jgi:hypothetical protein
VGRILQFLVPAPFDPRWSLLNLRVVPFRRTHQLHFKAVQRQVQGLRESRAVRMIAEYLEHAIRFEQLAKEEKHPKFKEELLRQATAYRKLAEERAKKLGLPMPKPPPEAT